MNDAMADVVPSRFNAVVDAAAPLAAVFHAAGHRMYLVGGVVRDHWLGIERDNSDLDATTDARPDRIKQLVAGVADAVWSQGERFGTIGCTIEGRTYEITTHRTEVYASSSRKPEVAFGDQIDDDLARRDFTVNAMAVDVLRRVLVDPFDGRGDLDRRVLRTPLDPAAAFSEDPLRMLRAARFHAGYDLEPAPELAAAVTAMGDRMEIVSAERIREELDKLIRLVDPAPGLRFLASTGLLRWVVPELADQDERTIDQVGRRIGAVSSDPAPRWAALLLDVDDPAVRLRALRSSTAHVSAVLALIAARPLLPIATMPDVRASLRRVAANTKGMRVEDVVAFWRAVRGIDGFDVTDLERLSAVVGELRRSEPDLDDPAPLLSGDEVIRRLGLAEGPDVGRALRWLRDLRFDEGPISEDEAAERLAAWWPEQRSSDGD